MPLSTPYCFFALQTFKPPLLQKIRRQKSKKWKHDQKKDPGPDPHAKKTDQTQPFHLAHFLLPSQLQEIKLEPCDQKKVGKKNHHSKRPRHPTFPNKSDKIVPSCHFFYYRPSLAACALLPQSKEFCFSNDVKENKKEKTNVSSGRGIRRGI